MDAVNHPPTMTVGNLLRPVQSSFDQPTAYALKTTA
jgi:hypothetical protein